MAEKTAWDFVKELPEDEKFEIVTINPSWIIGPVLCGRGFASEKLVIDLVNGKHPGMPKVKMGVVDVREVALAHLKAVQVEGAANQRFILSN